MTEFLSLKTYFTALPAVFLHVQSHSPSKYTHVVQKYTLGKAGTSPHLNGSFNGKGKRKVVAILYPTPAKYR